LSSLIFGDTSFIIVGHEVVNHVIGVGGARGAGTRAVLCSTPESSGPADGSAILGAPAGLDAP
jgi:hypothetical protein